MNTSDKVSVVIVCMYGVVGAVAAAGHVYKQFKHLQKKVERIEVTFGDELDKADMLRAAQRLLQEEDCYQRKLEDARGIIEKAKVA